MPSVHRTRVGGQQSFSPPKKDRTVISVKRCPILDNCVGMMECLKMLVERNNTIEIITPKQQRFKVFMEEMVKYTNEILKLQLFITKNLKADNCIKKLLPALKIKSENACHNLLEVMEKSVEDGDNKESEYLEHAVLVQILHKRNLRYFDWIDREYRIVFE